jgi:alpha-1,3/alpha-1,6-mannosyltransferase
VCGKQHSLFQRVSIFFIVDASHRESRELGISSEVVFLPSISSEKKADLLARCLCVMYTPEDEHFGIVPLEAMAAGKPVLACNSGGPVESIVDGVTGILCAPVAEVRFFFVVFLSTSLHRIILRLTKTIQRVQEFASAMQKVSENPETAARMGFLARLHVNNKFSRKAFGAQLNYHFADLKRAQDRPASTRRHEMFFFWACLLLSAAFVYHH